MKNIWNNFLVLAAFLSVCIGFGADGFAASPQEDLQLKKQISEKARARAYDGGIDEQPIVVQQNLTEPRTDGSEYILQKKILSDTGTGEDSGTPVESSDETSSGF
jgi:hypothetical protein